MTRATDTFLESLLLNSINKIKQPNRERGCVPTTAAIIVDYHDRHLGKNNLIVVDENDEHYLIALRDYFVEETGALDDSVSFEEMADVLDSYIRSKGYRPIINYETTLLNTGTLTTGDFYTVLAEITYNRPVMVIAGYDGFVYDNPIAEDSDALHALTVYGAKENLSGEYHYLKVYDSIDGHTKEVIWDTFNSAERSHFAIYGVEYINIK